MTEPGRADAPARLFVDQALANPANRAILQRLPALGLPDAWLVAGCLFQTVWNLRGGRPPAEGIRDHDLFYFDASDLSPEAEAALRRVRLPAQRRAETPRASRAAPSRNVSPGGRSETTRNASRGKSKK